MNSLKFKIALLGTIALLIGISIGGMALATPNKSCQKEEYRQFDFWIGEWDVYDAKDTLVGHNNIFPILNGCALSENWKSVKGNPGVSYNFYDAAEQKWHQTWVDQSGGTLYLDGGFKDNKMVLSGFRPNKEGGKVLHKITWTPLKDGRVKQHWQASENKGQNWTDVFVGFYKRK